jgi:hypothetical protein
MEKYLLFNLPYFEGAEIGEEVDPARMYEIKSELDADGVYEIATAVPVVAQPLGESRGAIFTVEHPDGARQAENVMGASRMAHIPKR